VKAKISPAATGTMYKFSDGKPVTMLAAGFELTLPALSYEIYTKTVVR
jgi:hypothetical protein